MEVTLLVLCSFLLMGQVLLLWQVWRGVLGQRAEMIRLRLVLGKVMEALTKE